METTKRTSVFLNGANLTQKIIFVPRKGNFNSNETKCPGILARRP
jgi:hypothetical protein